MKKEVRVELVLTLCESGIEGLRDSKYTELYVVEIGGRLDMKQSWHLFKGIPYPCMKGDPINLETVKKIVATTNANLVNVSGIAQMSSADIEKYSNLLVSPGERIVAEFKDDMSVEQYNGCVRLAVESCLFKCTRDELMEIFSNGFKAAKKSSPTMDLVSNYVDEFLTNKKSS